MRNTFEVDMTGYNESIQRLLRMGEVRRRDIAAIFRDADRGVVSMAKATVRRSPKGMISRKYPQRSHESGFLKKSIKFVVSKKRTLVYYVNPGAWYAMIYSVRFNPFMERAVTVKEQQVQRLITKGLDNLVQKVKDGK